jgi:hypothetical protein
MNTSQSTPSPCSLSIPPLPCRCHQSCKLLTPLTSCPSLRQSHNPHPLLVRLIPPSIRGCLPAIRGCLTANRGCAPPRSLPLPRFRLVRSQSCQLISAPRGAAHSISLPLPAPTPSAPRTFRQPSELAAEPRLPANASCTPPSALHSILYLLSSFLCLPLTFASSLLSTPQ